MCRNEMMLSNQMRLLWEQHVYWTRMLISGIVFGSPDVEQTKARLLRNPADFAAVLSQFYGRGAAEEFEDLFTSHLTIAAQLVTEAKAGNAVCSSGDDESGSGCVYHGKLCGKRCCV